MSFISRLRERSSQQRSSDEKTETAQEGAAVVKSGDEIPDGGLAAYFQVFGAFFLFVNSWGIVNTFGAYQDYYVSSNSMLSNKTPSAISWIGTLQGFLLLVVGILCGPVFDRGYVRHLIIFGSLFVVFGMMMTSLSHNYWQVLLAQGVCVGVGAGCLFLPSVAIMATYFTSKRAFMTGITNAGGSVGSVIYPIVFRKLQPSLGFPWATRIIGFIALATLTVSASIMRMRPGQARLQARALLEVKAFREPPFTIFSIGLFFTFVGLYFPFFYTSIYATRVLGLSEDVAFYLLPVMNAGSLFGRVVPGLVADKIGSLNSIIPCAIATAALSFAWLGINNAAGIWIFSVLYGFFSGAIVSLPATIVARLSPDLKLVGTRMGMSFTFAGVGFLIGNPIAGALLNIPEGKFRGAQLFSALTLLAGSVAFIIVWVILTRQKRAWKV